MSEIQVNTDLIRVMPNQVRIYKQYADEIYQYSILHSKKPDTVYFIYCCEECSFQLKISTLETIVADALIKNVRVLNDLCMQPNSFCKHINDRKQQGIMDINYTMQFTLITQRITNVMLYQYYLTLGPNQVYCCAKCVFAIGIDVFNPNSPSQLQISFDNHDILYGINNTSPFTQRCVHIHNIPLATCFDFTDIAHGRDLNTYLPQCSTVSDEIKTISTSIKVPCTLLTERKLNTVHDKYHLQLGNIMWYGCAKCVSTIGINVLDPTASSEVMFSFKEYDEMYQKYDESRNCAVVNTICTHLNIYHIVQGPYLQFIGYIKTRGTNSLVLALTSRIVQLTKSINAIQRTLLSTEDDYCRRRFNPNDLPRLIAELAALTK